VALRDEQLVGQGRIEAPRSEEEVSDGGACEGEGACQRGGEEEAQHHHQRALDLPRREGEPARAQPRQHAEDGTEQDGHEEQRGRADLVKSDAPPGDGAQAPAQQRHDTPCQDGETRGEAAREAQPIRERDLPEPCHERRGEDAGRGEREGGGREDARDVPGGRPGP